jgi:predicted amidohydrolase YtcJ
MRSFLSSLVSALAISLVACGTGSPESPTADLILHHGKVWTANPAQPLAEAVAVRGERIVRVGDSASVLALAGPGTRIVDLAGRFVAPGFNDAHTHLENAADWFFQVRLIDVNDQATMNARLRDAVARVPPGIWITGGDWGDFASTAAGAKATLLEPNLAEIDAISPDHPVLFRRADRSYFANSKAFAMAHVERGNADPRGGRFGRDASGALNGMLYGTAGEFLGNIVTPVSLEQKLIGARAVIAQLNRVGITSINDISRLQALDDETLQPVFLERSFSDVRIFQRLKERGQLNLRVYAFMPLDYFEGLAKFGIAPNSGDAMLRYGALKAFIDSNLMLPPKTALSGGYSYRFMGDPKFAQRIADGDKAGFDLGIHVTGDKAVQDLINAYERAAAANGPRDRRDRLIHAMFVDDGDFVRAGRMHLIADVTSDHLLANAHAADQALDPKRAGNAFAWRRMIDSGIRINLVSDLPGSFNKAILAETDPLINMYVAVTRRSPKQGAAPFHAEQAITVEEALRAYTINPAFSSREEALKGSIEPGKLADLVVLSKDILGGDPHALLESKVVMTFLGGKPVYRNPQDPPPGR